MLVHEVKAVYFDVHRGLYLLIKLDNQGRETGKWTFPGTELGPHESFHDGVAKIVREQIGLEPLSIAGEPLYKRAHSENNNKVLVLAYEVDLNMPHSHKAPRASRFVSGKYFSMTHLTRNTFDIMHSSGFAELFKRRCELLDETLLAGVY